MQSETYGTKKGETNTVQKPLKELSEKEILLEAKKLLLKKKALENKEENKNNKT